jgi:hypothetical protein
MADSLVTHQHRDFDCAVDAPFGEEDQYKMPLVPKIALILNINATMWAATITVVVTVLRHNNNIENIVAISNLILCFIVGAVVAGLSCCCDYAARRLYKIEASKKVARSSFAEICDVSAIGIVLASFGILVWGVWSLFSLSCVAFR